MRECLKMEVLRKRKTSVELFFLLFNILVFFFIVLVLSELHDLTPGFDDVKKKIAPLNGKLY